MNMTIHYSDGSKIDNAIVQIWDDLHEEHGGFFRAFWCATPEASTGSPVIGYCSPGGSHRTVSAVAREVWKFYPDAQIFRNGKAINK